MKRGLIWACVCMMIGSVVVMEKTLNKDKKHVNETQEHVMDEIVVKAEKIKD